MNAQLWRDLGQLIWTWYSHDRVRVSPAEGRLLRVQPGDLMTVGDIDVMVIDRSIIEGSAGLCICLICEAKNGIAELQLTMFHQETLQLVWIEAGHRRPFVADDVQVWPRNP